MRRLLIAIGLLLAGLGWLWPWLVRFGGALRLGRLPGDINVDRPGVSFHVLLGTSLLVSVVLSVGLTLLLWLMRR
jgi:hypothetical protein